MKKIKKRLVVGLLACGVIGFVGLNVLASKHAYAMMNYGSAEGRTRSPESLSFSEKARALFCGVSIPRPVSDRRPDELAARCVELSIESTDGATLAAWYVSQGETRPLVILFHGYKAEKTALLSEARAFLELGASVLLVDFRGSGGSSESYTTVGVDEADDVVASLRLAQEQLGQSRIILFGQSMGAAAILRAVHTQGIRPDAVIVEAVFDSLFNTVCNRFELMHAPSFPGAQLLMLWAGRQQHVNSFAHKPVDYAASLTCPSLFMHGSADPRAKLEEGRRVFDAAPEPKTFLIFEAVGHESYLSTYPDEWKAAVSALIAKTDRTR